MGEMEEANLYKVLEYTASFPLPRQLRLSTVTSHTSISVFYPLDSSHKSFTIKGVNVT